MSAPTRSRWLEWQSPANSPEHANMDPTKPTKPTKLCSEGFDGFVGSTLTNSPETDGVKTFLKTPMCEPSKPSKPTTEPAEWGFRPS
jgi:hypothetical protein